MIFSQNLLQVSNFARTIGFTQKYAIQIWVICFFYFFYIADENKLTCAASVIHASDLDDITNFSTSEQIIESFINNLVSQCLTLELLDLFSFKPVCDKFLPAAIEKSLKLLFEHISSVDLFLNFSVNELALEEISEITNFMERLNAESICNTPHRMHFRF